MTCMGRVRSRWRISMAAAAVALRQSVWPFALVMVKLPAPLNSVKCRAEAEACPAAAWARDTGAPGKTDKLVRVKVADRKISNALDFENTNRHMCTLPPEPDHRPFQPATQQTQSWFRGED